jgi:hypothetical protein
MDKIKLERESDEKNINLITKNSNSPVNLSLNKTEFYNTTNNNIDQDGNEEDIGLEYLVNGNKKNDEEDAGNSDIYSEAEVYSEGGSEVSSMGLGGREDIGSEETYEEIQNQKILYLTKLRRLSKNTNLIIRKLNLEHSLEEIKAEIARINAEIYLDDGLEYCRNGLLFLVNSMEMMNKTFSPFGADLNGWSNVVMSEITSYDSVFEELCIKYSNSVVMPPEMKLVCMIGSSAFAFHLKKKMAEKAFDMMNNKREMRGPSMNTDDILDELRSDASSDVSSVSRTSEKVIKVPAKKRGRKPKEKNK